MVRQKAAFLIFIGSLLSGCDKPKELDGLKSEVAADKKQIVELRSELANVKERLADLETAQKKVVEKNDGPQPLSEEQIAMLKKAIAQCVRTSRNAGKSELERQFSSQFDAYYNPASRTVKNNVVLNGGLPALYAFNKCMASAGWPLT